MKKYAILTGMLILTAFLMTGCRMGGTANTTVPTTVPVTTAATKPTTEPTISMPTDGTEVSTAPTGSTTNTEPAARSRTGRR